MAVHHGSTGLVKSGAAVVAEVTEWSYSESADVTERKILLGGGVSTPTPIVGSATGSGSVACHLDAGDPGQDAMTTGATVALSLHVGDDTSGNTVFSGNVVITGREISNGAEGVTTISFNYSGLLAASVVA